MTHTKAARAARLRHHLGQQQRQESATDVQSDEPKDEGSGCAHHGREQPISVTTDAHTDEQKGELAAKMLRKSTVQSKEKGVRTDKTAVDVHSADSIKVL
jgi:hypothetical protein